MSVTIQQGHVPRKRGSTGAPGEQTYNRAVAAEAARLLRGQGVIAKIIVADPSHYPHTRDFVAVHYDGSVNASAHGASAGYPDAAGGELAHAWKVAYRAEGFPGGFRHDNYTAGLRSYYAYRRSPSKRRIVTEGGFGSHSREGPWLRSKEGIATCARAIARAVTGKDVEEDDMPSKEEVADEVVKRLMSASVHGEPFANRVHNTDVHAERAARNAKAVNDKLGDRDYDREIGLLRRSLRKGFELLGVPVSFPTEEYGPDEVEA